MHKAIGFVDNNTNKIVTTEDAKCGRRIHRSIANLTLYNKKWGWVWAADAAGTLCPFTVLEDGTIEWTALFPTEKARRAVERRFT